MCTKTFIDRYSIVLLRGWTGSRISSEFRTYAGVFLENSNAARAFVRSSSLYMLSFLQFLHYWSVVQAALSSKLRWIFRISLLNSVFSVRRLSFMLQISLPKKFPFAVLKAFCIVSYSISVSFSAFFIKEIKLKS